MMDMETETELELDRISNLPNDVTEKILSRLPLREAVRQLFFRASGGTNRICFEI